MLEIELGNKEKKDFKKLQTKHNYWHQVQAEMVAVNISWAHFVDWTTKDICIIRVEEDPDWEKITPYPNELLHK